MPIYEYQCQDCGYLFEELQTMSEAALVTCPNCGKDELKKLIGSGGGIIFKGSGFYQTDYKKSQGAEKSSEGEKSEKTGKTEKSGENEKSTEKKESVKETSPQVKETKGGTASKPESKTETKTESKKDSSKDNKSSAKPEKNNKK